MKKFLVFVLILLPLRTIATDQPLYELGLFIGGAILPDYPAADQARSRTIPLPLLHYNGELFRADEKDGTRFRLINNENFDFDLSFGGSFPTETGNNQARAGMPNLDWTMEVGPRLLYYFYRNPDVAQIRVGLPLRLSFATNFTKSYGLGSVFAPAFQIEKYNLFTEGLELFFNYTVTSISQGVADFFFQIEPRYQTTERAAFNAKPGILGSEISLAIKYKFSNKHLILGAQYSDYSQSANTQSYLHRSDINWSYVMALTWVLYESKERAVHSITF